MSEFGSIPRELKDRDQWLLWDASADTPRRPHWRGDFGISWSDPGDWHAFEEAVEAASERESWGIGYVMAYANDGAPAGVYACIDVDRGLDENGDLMPWVPKLDLFTDAATYIERSASGGGLHIPVYGAHIPEWWADSQFDEHTGVDVLENKFCVFTGDAIDEGGEGVADVNPTAWLFDAYREINGESPRLKPSGDGEQRDYDGDEWLEAGEIRDALKHVDPDVEYSTWRDIGFAIHDFDSGSTGKSLFEDWSRGGSKWDDRAERYVNAIWESASPGDGVTVGTLIHHAREGGWSMPKPEGAPTTDGGAVAASAASSRRASPEEPDGPGDKTSWDDVRALFDSDANGTTTKGYSKAVEILEREYTIVTIRDSEAIYFYDDFSGFYRRKGQTFVRELIEGHLRDAANENRKREILSKWRDRNFVSVDDFKPPKGKVNVENGVLDLDTREKEEHTPDYYFTNQLNVEYNPDAEGGLWVDQLERAVGDPEEIEKLEQFVGYCLETWHHEREKNMFFVGKSRTGKSTIQEAIQALFGDAPTVTALTPQQLADTKFDAAALFEAALNTVNDINASKIKDSGSLKRMFSGERTKMENKYEDHFFAEPNAKHLFTANWLPRIVGTDEAIWRRILIIEFTDQLTEAEKDRTVKRRLKENPEVRQVILNRGLDARDKLNDQDHFTADRSMKDTRELWDSWRTNNKQFLYSHFEVTADPDEEVEKRTYWQAYNEWCAKHDYEPASNRSITKELGYVPGVGTSDDHHYTGLRWADNAESDDDSGEQAGLGPIQGVRKRKVREIIEKLSENGGAANVEQVKGYAAGQELDVDQVEHDIENWLKDGTITEAGGGKIYLT